MTATIDTATDYEHGTPAGYARHLRDRTKPCAGCRAANTRRINEYRLRTGRSTRTHVANITLAALLAAAPKDVFEQVVADLGAEQVAAIAKLNRRRRAVPA